MHISFGLPLISAEHEPHLPALQFQRTARSPRLLRLDAVHGVEHDHPLADLGRVVAERALRLSPRQMRNTAFDMVLGSCFVVRGSGFLVRCSWCAPNRRTANHERATCSPRSSASTPAGSGGSGTRDTCIAPPGLRLHDDVERRVGRVLVGIVLRGSGRRGSPCARSPIARSLPRPSAGCRDPCAVCQPGLYSRWPVTPACAGALLQRFELRQRAAASPLPCGRCRRGPASCPGDRCCTVKGFSCALAALERLERLLSSRPSTCRSSIDAPRRWLSRSSPRTRRRACRTPAGPTASCRRAGSRR